MSAKNYRDHTNPSLSFWALSSLASFFFGMIPTFRQNPSMHHPSQHMPVERPGISDPLIDFGGLPIPQRCLDCFAIKAAGKKQWANVVVTVVVENLQLCMWTPGWLEFNFWLFLGFVGNQGLADALTERGIVTPSPIQHLAMPKLAKGLLLYHFFTMKEGRIWWSFIASLGSFSLWFYTCSLVFSPPPNEGNSPKFEEHDFGWVWNYWPIHYGPRPTSDGWHVIPQLSWCPWRQ